LLVPSVLLVLALDRARAWPRLAACQGWVFGLASAAMLCLYLAAAGGYLFSHVFLDHIEPAITSLSWLFWHGKPLYQDLVTQERYSDPYGPYVYIFVALSQSLLGPGIFAAKLPCVLSGAASLILLFITIRRKAAPARALCWTGLAAALLLTFGNNSFWTRPDPFILLATVLGLFAATLDGIAGPILLGLSLGIAVNLKINSFLYFLPAMALALPRKWSIPGIITGLVITSGAALLPFVLFHNISPANYRALLKLGSERGFGIPTCLQVLQRFLFFILPIALAFAYGRTRDGGEFRQFFARQRFYLAALLVAFCFILPVASLRGSGRYHLMPFVPIIALVMADLPAFEWDFASPAHKCALAIVMIGCTWLGTCLVAGTTGFYQTLAPALSGNARAKACEEDLSQIVHDHPGDVVLAGVGSEDTYTDTFSRFVLADAGMPTGVDPSVLMDFDNTGHGQLDFQALISGIEGEENGKPILFVIPKDSVPFSMYSYQHIYPDDFREAFAAGYARVATTGGFDIYAPLGRKGPKGPK
jgi:hypothetical protein